MANDNDLSAENLRELVRRLQDVVYEKHTARTSRRTRAKQLEMAINAVFNSWNNPRAITYRQINEITVLKGTAVNVQTMVFGNMGETAPARASPSPATRATGENLLYGEYLVNAQGEDVVAGIRTPEPRAADAAARERPIADHPADLMKIATQAREALQGHAGHRVHHRGGQTLHAPDPQRQAHRQPLR